MISNNKEIIYLDESGFVKNFIRKFGYSKRGVKINDNKIGNRAKNTRTTVISAYSNKKFLAPFYFEGNTDTEIFLYWIKRFLCPNLQSNHVVIMDNASFHKSPKIRQLIESKGAKLLYLPTYSPDLNPIEHRWGSLKRNLELIQTNTDNFNQHLDYFLCNKKYQEISY